MSDTTERDAVQMHYRGIALVCEENATLRAEVDRLRAENAALKAAVERVLALHYCRDVSDELHHVCRECEQAHPCPTLRALEGTP